MPQFGTYTDSRDGHVYTTVLMPDGKWWAAENLAWAGAGRDYNDNPANRAIYGRLYSSYESVEAVPQGTKVPTREDFNALIAVSGGSKAGIALKSTDLWRYGAGTNVLGFDGRPGGFGVESGFYSMRSSGNFWAAPDPSDLVNSPYVSLEDYSDILFEYDSIKTNLFYIRFIVDSGNVPDVVPDSVATQEYTAPLYISKNTTIKAIAVHNGLSSSITHASYIIVSNTGILFAVDSQDIATIFGRVTLPSTGTLAATDAQDIAFIHGHVFQVSSYATFRVYSFELGSKTPIPPEILAEL